MSEFGADQAEGLRRMNRNRPVRVLAVASGKGGVGKTNVSVNLSVAFAQLGRRVMLLDADLGLANADVMLGLQPRANLSHVLDGTHTLEDVIIPGPSGISVVPAASGVARMASLSPTEHAGIVRAFSELRMPLDILIVDTAAGISDSVTSFARAAQEVLVVVCDEPASITDAYALIKVLNRDHGIDRFQLVANMVHDNAAGMQLFRKLAMVCERFLDVVVRYAGYVPFDTNLRRAVQRQRSVVDALPSAPASIAFKKLATAADKWAMRSGAPGQLSFFIERLIDAQPATETAVAQ